MVEPAANSRADVTVRRFPARIGRALSSDVCLEDESVSATHATLEEDAGQYLLRDAGSTNGTLIGGVRIASRGARLVSHGDVFRIGRFWVQAFLEATAPEAPDLDTRELALGMMSKVLGHLPREHAVRVVEGPGRGELLELDEDVDYVFGREARCALRLAGALISREHVRVIRRGDAVYARDGGSHNGSAIGDETLRTDVETLWNPIAHLKMGDAVLALCARRPPLDELLGIAKSEPGEREVKVTAPPKEEAAPAVVEAPVPATAPEPPKEVLPPVVVAPTAQAPRAGRDPLVILPIVAVLAFLICAAGLGWLLFG